MEHNELIHNLVDGSLDSSHEEQLFLTLASSDEARSELKQQIAIKNAIRADKMAYTPRVQSTMNVFNTLGFTPLSTVAPIPVKTGFGNSLLKMVQTYSQGIIGGVIAAAATSFVIFTFFMPEAKIQSASNSGNSQVISKNIVTNENNIQNNSAPNNTTINSFTNENNVISKSSRQSKTPKFNFIKSDTQNSNINTNPNLNANIAQNQTQQQVPENKIQENAVPLDLASISNVIQSNNNALNYNSMPVNEPLSINEQKYKDMSFLNVSNDYFNGWSVEFRKSEVWFSQNPTIYPSNLATFNNSSIAIMYNLSNELAAGFDLRQETFFQTFSHDSSGYTLQFEQQPNFTSYGAFIRWQPEFLSFWNINPLLQITGGGNEAGYIGRGMLGLSFSPYRGITFVGGYEFSNFWYSHLNNTFNNSKYNLNYGIKFNF